MAVTKRFADRLAQERRLKAAREEREIPNSEIARAVDTSDANVSKWLSGAAVPRDKTLAALADYFGVNRSWLRYGEGEREAPEKDVPRADASLYEQMDAKSAKKRSKRA